MHSLSSALLALAIFSFNCVAHPHGQYDKGLDLSKCQAASGNIRAACPPGTLIVGKDNAACDFHSVQEAIESIGNDTKTHYILILAGTYTEQVNITRQAPLWLLGQTSNNIDATQNQVTLNWASATNITGMDNAQTSTLTVAPTFNASRTGSGNTGFAVPDNTPFGCKDFRVYNVDIINTFAPRTAGPSLAISVSRANAGFYFTNIMSYQDTVYIGKLGNAYVYGGQVGGQTDFMYGFGTLWVENADVTLRGCGGGMIAWKGTNTSTPNAYGAYVSNSFIRPENGTIASSYVGKCSLGRPWNSQHRSVYLNTYMDADVLPQGYTKWNPDAGYNFYNNYTFMAEYKSYGPGWNLTARLAGSVTKVLDDQEVAQYSSPAKVFVPNIDWIDRRYLKG